MKEDRVKDVQVYLKKKGIKVSETAIVDAAIKIATRWGGNYVFVVEFEGGASKEKESDGE